MSGITDLEDPNTVHYEVNIFLFFLNHYGKYKKGITFVIWAMG